MMNDNISTAQSRQEKTSSGLRDRLFATLDGVIAGKVEKEQVEAIVFLSQEILKSAKVDLEFEAKAQERLQLQFKIEQERRESVNMITNIIDDIGDEDEKLDE